MGKHCIVRKVFALTATARDCTRQNIMMDPSRLYPVPFHPVKQDVRRDWKGAVRHNTRTMCAPRYYLIDFGLSHRYRVEEVAPLRMPAFGGDKSVSEHQPEVYHIPCDPFPTDVYYLGSLVEKSFMQVSHWVL